MRIRRRTARAVVVIALTLSGCGGGTADTIEVEPPSTTTAPTTTTSTSTTTTTLPPIPEISLEAPEMPPAVLTDDHGGPLEIATYCEIAYAEATDGTEIWGPIQTAAFGFMGVEPSSEECDIALDDLVESSRYSANYTGIGQCFTGWTVFGDVVARVGGQEWTWPVDIDREPPMSITSCTRDEEPPGGPVPFRAVVEPFRQPFEDLFGPLGTVAAAYAAGYWDWYDEPPAPEVIDVLAAGLHIPDPELRCQVAELVEYLVYQLEELAEVRGAPIEPSPQALVPHLVKARIDLDTRTEGDGCGDSIDDALRLITGQDFSDARSWAGWWLDTQSS